MNQMKKSNTYPHVYWVDLNGDGLAKEVAVIKRDRVGNLYFIQLNKLDEIDLNRMFNILRNRNASHFELWDLMAQVTLGNGVNALKYFHQLVKVLSPSGTISDPKSGEVGIGQMQIAPAPVAPEVQAPEAKKTNRKKTT